MISDPSSQPEWSEMVELRFKAKSFDDLMKKLEGGVKDDPDSSQRGAKKLKSTPKKEDTDWMSDDSDRSLSQPAVR
jgi:hypothetical protein